MSGWGNVTYELCSELVKRGDIDFELLLPKGAVIDSDIPFSSRIRDCLPPIVRSFRRSPHWLPRFLLPRMKVGETDLIHTLIEFPYGILAWRLARRERVPFIITTQGTYGVVPMRRPFDRSIYIQAMKSAAFVTAPSRFTAEEVRKASGMNKEIIEIHNAVNYARFQRPAVTPDIRSRFGLPEKAQLVLGVGALKARKGFDLLIDAFEQVIHKRPQAHLVISGHGPRHALRQQASSLGIGENVHIVGGVSADDLVGLYQLSHVYAHLPRSIEGSFEGFGIVYLEAGACGKPVVGTRSGGVEDAVMDGETGFLVDEGDISSAADVILRLLGDDHLAHTMGQAGRDNALRHTWSWYANEIVALYKRSLE